MMLNPENIIIALDLDGTLLRSDKSVSDFTVETLKNLSQTGCEIFFVTGRRKRVADDVLKPFDFPSWLIANNGTTCYRRPSSEIIYTHFFPREKVEFIIDTLEQINKKPVLIISDDKIQQDMVMEKSHLDIQVYRDYFEKSKSFIITENILKKSAFIDKVTGIFLTEANTEIQNVISFLKSKTNGNYKFISLDNLNFLPTHTILEILEPSMTKWNAICRLKKIIGKENAKVIAFGDDHNDLDMLSFADESYAMENAIIAAKSASKKIAPSNENDGVAKILTKILHL